MVNFATIPTILITRVRIRPSNRLGSAGNVGWQQRPPPLEESQMRDGTETDFTGFVYKFFLIFEWLWNEFIAICSVLTSNSFYSMFLRTQCIWNCKLNSFPSVIKEINFYNITLNFPQKYDMMCLLSSNEFERLS